MIRQVHQASRGTYGAHRVHAELTMGYGITVGRHAVAMLMRRAGLAGLPGNRRRNRLVIRTDTAVNLVDRDFVRNEPDQLWVTDITEHRTTEGKVYCAVVVRRIQPTRGGMVDRLVTDRHPGHLSIGDGDQQPETGRDRDPFRSRHPIHFMGVTQRAQESGLVPSMGSIGDCFDNALVESFWARMQVKLLNRQRWRTRIELANAIFGVPRDLPQPSTPPFQAWGCEPRSNTRESTTTTNPRHD